MRRITLFFVISLMTVVLSGQTIKIQSGITLSTHEHKALGEIRNYDVTQSLPFLIGVDYFHHDYYHLSTNVGFIKKGSDKIIDIFEYITLNTTLDLTYKMANDLIPFVSVGPRLDYMTYNDRIFDIHGDDLSEYSAGLLLGGGIKYNFNNIQVGIRGDYYLNFNKIAEWSWAEGHSGYIEDYTGTINLFIGYNF